MGPPSYMRSVVEPNAVMRLITVHVCVFIYIYIHTLVSLTVLISVYKTLNEPIQQHTAVHYNSQFRRTAINLCLHQTAFITLLHLQQPSAVCLLSVLKVPEEKKNLMFIELGKVNLFYCQNDAQNPTIP